MWYIDFYRAPTAIYEIPATLTNSPVAKPNIITGNMTLYTLQRALCCAAIPPRMQLAKFHSPGRVA